MGRWSFHAGYESAALGVVIHYFIALTWTVIFYLASRKLTILVRRPVICGSIYGVVVYAVMNAIVLPLSRIPHSRNPMALAARVNGVLALMFCIGLTIALLVRRYSLLNVPNRLGL